MCDSCGDALASWRPPADGAFICLHCRFERPAVAKGRCAGRYEGMLRDIIHAFKYDSRSSLGDELSALMRRAGAEVLDGADCAVPVPLHPWRRLRRGFNQAELLARGLGIPVVHALWRTRLTTPQSRLHGAARRDNVSRAFAISPRMWPERRHRRWLDGKCVVLVDDVWTTGATLCACAEVLLVGGVREVRALTLARAAPPATKQHT